MWASSGGQRAQQKEATHPPTAGDRSAPAGSRKEATGASGMVGVGGGVQPGLGGTYSTPLGGPACLPHFLFSPYTHLFPLSLTHLPLPWFIHSSSAIHSTTVY